MKKCLLIVFAMVFVIAMRSNLLAQSQAEMCHFGSRLTKSVDEFRSDVQSCLAPVQRFLDVSFYGGCTIFFEGNANAVGEFQLCMDSKGYPDFISNREYEGGGG